MSQGFELFGAYDLHAIVERLSMHDRRRILRLIELFQRAPDSLRELTQVRICELIASEPDTHAECAEGIDEIIEGAELEVAGGSPITIGDAGPVGIGEYSSLGRRV